MDGKVAAGRAEVAFLAGTAAGAAGIISVFLRLWRADLRVPFVYFYDAIFNATAVKSIIQHGWFLHNPSLGAPAGLNMHDFPLGGDNLQFLLIKGLGLLSGDWALVMNAYFLFGFVLTALAAYVVLRQVGASRWTSLALANLFAFLPYHFVLGETQLFQSAYFVVPFGVLLVLDALGWNVWRSPFLGFAAEGRGRVRLRRWVVRAGLAALVASAGSYYAPFTMVLLVAAACVAVLLRERRTAFRAIAVIALLGAVLTANNVPAVLYQLDHGRNDQVADRALGESDLYALRVVDLFLPIQAHRLAPFAAVKARLDRFWPVSPVWPAPQTPLGLVSAFGVALSLGVVASAVGLRRRAPSPTRNRLFQLGLLSLFAIMVGVSTGLSSLVGLVGITEIRVWSRMSVFIGFFGLVAVGLTLEALGPYLTERIRSPRLTPSQWRALGVVVALAGVSLGVLDQTQPGMVPPYAANRSVFADDRSFVDQVEKRMPPGAAIFQLPLASFPERPSIAGLLDYGLLRGYLHSKTLRWSYGSMRGRPADWAWSLGRHDVESMLDGATAAGFTGLYVDRAGFFDQGAALEAELGFLVGPPAVVSDHGLAFWDLRNRAALQRERLGMAAVAHLRRLVLQPVVPRWGWGFLPPVEPSTSAGVVPGLPVTAGDFLPYPSLPGPSFVTLRPAGPTAELELRNPLPETRPVRVKMTVRTASPTGDEITFTADGKPSSLESAGPEARPVEFTLRLPPGTLSLRIRSAKGAGFWVGNLVVLDSRAG